MAPTKNKKVPENIFRHFVTRITLFFSTEKFETLCCYYIKKIKLTQAVFI